MRLKTTATAAVLAAIPLACCLMEQCYFLDPSEAISYTAVIKDKDQSGFIVELEMVVFASQIKEYPKTYEAFKQAVEVWTSKVPVRMDILTEDTSIKHPFFGPMVYSSSTTVVEVHIADIQSPAYGYQKLISAVGIWESDNRRLLLDGDVLEEHPDIAMSTALHEIGHMFGLPHIVNKNDKSYTSYIILEQNAESYTMYPTVFATENQKQLSDLEVSLATHNIIHGLTTPGGLRNSQKCHLTYKE